MTKLHVVQQGSGPKILFIHGGEEAGGATAFAAQAPLATSYTLILPDLPGHGQTPLEGMVDVERDAGLVTELLTEPMHLLGHSFGGGVALRVTANRPEMVRSLTLIEPNALDIAIDDPEVMTMLMELVQAIQISDLRERVIRFAEALGIQKIWPDPLPETYRQLSENLPLMTRPNPNSLSSQQLADKVTAGGIPTLVISGGHRTAWEHICDRIATALKAQRAVVTGFGHAPQLNAQDFNACVEQFWAQIP